MKHKRYLYHATSRDNESSILKEGLRPGQDGVVYMCGAPDEAMRFMALRWDIDKFSVFQIDTRMLNNKNIHESFDHNERFFGCKAWYHIGNIPSDVIMEITHYEREDKQSSNE